MSQASTIAVVGGGTIGLGLAQAAIAAGQEVTLLVRRPEAAEDASVRLQAWGVRRRLEVPDDVVALGLDPVATADVILEAVTEDAAIKHTLLRELEGRVPADALLCTTTSSLALGHIAAGLRDPLRLCAFHVFNPVERMELVEVSVLPDAPAHIAARAFALAEALGKQPIAVPPDPGFVVNRVLFPLLFEAARLHERTRLEPSALDACVKLGAGHPMGPLALLDLIGLDVASAIGAALELPVPEVIADHVAAGALGRKSGAGFYTYTA